MNFGSNSHRFGLPNARSGAITASEGQTPPTHRAREKCCEAVAVASDLAGGETFGDRYRYRRVDNSDELEHLAASEAGTMDYGPERTRGP